MIRDSNQRLLLFGTTVTETGIKAELVFMGSTMPSKMPVIVEGEKRWLEIPEKYRGLAFVPAEPPQHETFKFIEIG